MSLRPPAAVHVAILVAALAASFVNPVALSSQGTSRWLPGLRPFAPLLAAPRETRFRGSLVLSDRPDALDYPGRNIEAEVVIGHSLAILRMDGGAVEDRAVTLGYEFGIFSRFYMENRRKDLINVDYRVGLPLAIRHDEWQVRITVRHMSSHVGDDYLTRFPESVIQKDDELHQRTRDGVEGLLARTFGGSGRIYAGGDFNFHINPRLSRAVLRTGLEWDPRGAGADDRVWPFIAANFEYPSFTGRSATTLVAEMGAMVNRRLLRVEARGHIGASPMGQTDEMEETFFGLGISLLP